MYELNQFDPKGKILNENQIHLHTFLNLTREGKRTVKARKETQCAQQIYNQEIRHMR